MGNMRKSLLFFLIILFSSLILISCQEENALEEGSTSENNNGKTTGNEISITGDVGNITFHSAILSGFANITPGNGDIKMGILCSKNEKPTVENSVVLIANELNVNNEFSVTASNLESETSYYYCSFVNQSGIWFKGEVKTFCTQKIGTLISTGNATEISCYSSLIGGAVSVEEGINYDSLSYGFCVSSIDSIPSVEKSDQIIIGNKREGDSYSYLLSGLSGSSNYYYCSFARIDGYYIYGEVRSFKTLEDDVVITGDIDSITCVVTSTLTIGEGNYKAIEYGVCYGLLESPTIADNVVRANNVDINNQYTLTLTEIEGGVVFYRAFVIIDGSAHYGSIKSMELLSFIKITTNNLSKYHNSLAIYGTKQNVTDDSDFGGVFTDEHLYYTSENRQVVNQQFDVNNKDSIIWNYTPSRYWEWGYDYSFAAYAPASGRVPMRYVFSTPNTMVGNPNNGYATFVNTTDGNIYFQYYKLVGTNLQSTPSLSLKNKGFTVENGGDIDIMVSDVITRQRIKNKDEIELKFKHVLSKLNIYVSKQFEAEGCTLYVTKVEVTGLKDGGIYSDDGKFLTSDSITSGWVSVLYDDNYHLLYEGNQILERPNGSLYFIESLVMPQSIREDQVYIHLTYRIAYNDGTWSTYKTVINIYPFGIDAFMGNKQYTIRAKIQPGKVSWEFDKNEEEGW